MLRLRTAFHTRGGQDDSSLSPVPPPHQVAARQALRHHAWVQPVLGKSLAPSLDSFDPLDRSTCCRLQQSNQWLRLGRLYQCGTEGPVGVWMKMVSAFFVLV